MMAKYADEPGLITYANGDVHKSDLAEAMGGVVQSSGLDQGVKPGDVFVGPSWWLLTELEPPPRNIICPTLTWMSQVFAG